MTDQVNFGDELVSPEEKTRRVGAVFSSVARRYDMMNDLMSMGLHRAWKAFTLLRADLRPGQRVLDIAGGTGDLAQAFARKVGSSGLVVHTDINPTGVVPKGPDLANWGEPHGRESLGGRPFGDGTPPDPPPEDERVPTAHNPHVGDDGLVHA